MEGITKSVMSLIKVLGLMFIVALAGAIGKDLSRSAVNSSKERDIAGILSAAASEINKSVPTMVDAETRMDQAVAGPGLQLTYEHTFIEFPAPGQNPFDIFDDLDAKSARLKQRVCQNEAMTTIFREGVTVIYRYKDKSGKQLFDVTIFPKDCSV